MKELKDKIVEALISALPITAIVYVLALTPLVDFTGAELLTFTVGAVLLVLGIGLLNSVRIWPWYPCGLRSVQTEEAVAVAECLLCAGYADYHCGT